MQRQVHEKIPKGHVKVKIAQVYHGLKVQTMYYKYLVKKFKNN